jgi:hypothetical protein
MKISIATLAGYKPDFLIRPFGELVLGSVRFIKNNPTVWHQLQVVEELAVMLPGFCNPNKLGYPAEGIHERMYFDTSFFSGTIQPVAAHTCLLLSNF